MIDDDLEAEMAELSTAEDFLEHFGIAYDPAVVQVSRLHILQRFHDYLEALDERPPEPGARRALYAGRLAQAYQDFLRSDPRTEKVFRVFRAAGPVGVALSDLTEQLPNARAL